MLIKRNARKTLDNSNLIRAADRLEAQDAVEFADQLQDWYEHTRSRASTANSIPRNSEEDELIDQLNSSDSTLEQGHKTQTSF